MPLPGSSTRSLQMTKARSRNSAIPPSASMPGCAPLIETAFRLPGNGRARVHRWHHDCHRLCPGEEAPLQRGLRAPEPRARHAQVDFGETPGVIGGVNASSTTSGWCLRTLTRSWSKPILPRRQKLSVTLTVLPSPSSAACPCRCSMTTPPLQLPRFAAPLMDCRQTTAGQWMVRVNAPGPFPSFNPTTCSTTSLAARSRAMTRVMLRAVLC